MGQLLILILSKTLILEKCMSAGLGQTTRKAPNAEPERGLGVESEFEIHWPPPG